MALHLKKASMWKDRVCLEAFGPKVRSHFFSPTVSKAWGLANKVSGWFGAAAEHLEPGSPQRFHIKVSHKGLGSPRFQIKVPHLKGSRFPKVPHQKGCRFHKGFHIKVQVPQIFKAPDKGALEVSRWRFQTWCFRFYVLRFGFRELRFLSGLKALKPPIAVGVSHWFIFAFCCRISISIDLCLCANFCSLGSMPGCNFWWVTC